MLDASADTDVRDSMRRTPLHYAARDGRQEVALLLINAGANINAVDQENSTALHFAVKNGHAPIVQSLVLNGADVNVRDADRQRTPLHYAVQNGQMEMVWMLMLGGAAIDAADADGMTPLHLAVTNNRTNLVEVFLSSSAEVNVDVRDKQLKTPLHYAARDGIDEAATILIHNGTDLNAVDVDGNAALHFAASNDDAALVELLITRGAKIDIENGKGETPLWQALRSGVEKVHAARVLMRYGASIDKATKVMV